MLKNVLISDLGDFRALEGAIDRLSDLFVSPMLRFDFFESYISAYVNEGGLRTFTVWEEDVLRAVASFYIVNIKGIERFELVGKETYEPLGLLYDNELVLSQLASFIFEPGIPVSLRRFELNSPESVACKKASALRFDRLVANGGSSAFSALDCDFVEFERRQSPKSRSEIRRNLRNLYRACSPEIDVVVPALENVDSVFEEFCVLENSGWKKGAGTSIYSDTKRELFFRLYCRRLAQREALRVFSLRHQGKAIAMRLSLLHANRLWDIKIAFDEAWRGCAPGILLTHETIKRGCDWRLQGHEFLGKIEAWQGKWPIEERSHETSYYLPRWYGSH